MDWNKILDYLCALGNRKAMMAEVQKVYVVVKAIDQGVVVLVASSFETAAAYIGGQPYGSFVMVERTIDKVEF